MTNIKTLIEREEGWRERPYLCSEGYPTVGFGFKLGGKAADTSAFDFVLPKPVGEVWLQVEIDAVQNCKLLAKYMHELKPARSAVLVSMVFQMGESGVSKFKKMFAALDVEDFDTAANEMLDSQWARQTPKRANRHAMQMRTGVWHPYYC